MELTGTPKRKSQIELEKEVFGYAIDAHRTYSNKRRKSFEETSKLTKENLSLQGKSYTPLTTKGQQNEIAHKVRPWLENCNRAALLDLDPNLGNHRGSKKMCLRSSSRFEGIENHSPNTHSKYIISPIKSPQKKSLGGVKKKTKKAKKSDKKNFNEPQKEVMVVHDSDSVQSDSTILIEGSHGTHLDKDQLAYMEVLQQASREEVRNLGGQDCIEFEPDSEDVRSCLQHTLDSLQLEITKLEQSQIEAVRLYRPRGKTMIWTTRSLLNVSNGNVKTVSEVLKKQDIKICNITEAPRDTNVLKKRILIKRKGTFGNRCNNKRQKFFKRRQIIHMVKRNPKRIRTVSVQTDIPFTHSSKIGSIPSVSPEHESTNKENNMETLIPKYDINCHGDFTESLLMPQLSQNRFSLNSAKSSYGILSDCESSVHKNCGNHTIHVQVHAGMDSQDSDNSSVVSAACLKRAVVGSLESVKHRALPDEGCSPSLYWEELHRTPPRSSRYAASGQSPTYTLTPPSNSSSNKENYAPNRTLSPDAKKLNKTKRKQRSEHVAPRLPLTLLFEAPRMKVYVCCSNLRQVELMSVLYVCTKLGWVYCEEYSCDVTHLIVKVDDDNRAQRDEKYYRAVSAGCYIVSYTWIDRCVREDCHCVEEEFEALDCSGEPGPLRSRTADEKLFKGITFSCQSTVPSVHMLTSCLEVAGARLVTAAQLAGTSLVGPVVVLHNPLFDKDREMLLKDAVSGWKVPTVIVKYEWALECIGRHRRVSPETFLASPQHRASQHVAWLYSVCDKHDGQTRV